MSPNPAPRLVAVVVTHNRLDHLQKTVGRLLDSPAADLDGLVVVDNASDDGTAAWLAAQSDPRLDVLRLAVNGGGAGGFEAACAMPWVSATPIPSCHF